MVMALPLRAVAVVTAPNPITISHNLNPQNQIPLHSYIRLSIPTSRTHFQLPTLLSTTKRKGNASCFVLASLSSSSSSRTSPPKTRLFVSGLSFRTTEESLRNAFKNFGELLEVNLVMDKLANRPRGFAFLRYATEDESQKAIEGMHGKFLDGRVIFVEAAKPRSELKENRRHY